mgnify:CR=1 FL=1
MIKISLNEKIYWDLYRKIQAQHYEPGALLPTEQEMEKIYDTSRAPIRQALGKLENEGLINRRAGKGTFVTQREATGPWLTLGGFGQELSTKWDDLTGKTLSVTELKATEEVAQNLSIAFEAPVVETIRLRLLNGVPIYYLQHYTTSLNINVIKAAGDIKTMRPLFVQARINISYVSEEISAVGADDNIAKHLTVKIHYPVMQVKRISYNEDYLPVEYLKYYVVTEDWKYRIQYKKY